MYEWSLYLCLLALLLVGWFLNLLGLPGLWVMVAAAVGYAWATDWLLMSWPGLVALLVLALLAELVEFLAGAAGAKSAGGTKRGMAGAIIGGLIGGVIGTGLIPIPIVGTVAGLCLGSFAGAAGVEMMIHRDREKSIAVGIGAAKGRFWGTVWKSAIGVVMIVVALAAGFPWGISPLSRGAQPALPGPTTLPATLPTAPSTLPALPPTTVPTTDIAVEP